MTQKTYVTKARDIKRSWHLIDLSDKILGRQASKIAMLLSGKQKPYFTPNLDCGDYVVAINAGRIMVSGKKMKQKIYEHHSGYPGGFRQFTLEEMMKRDPTKIVRLAVVNMLSKNRLRDQRMKRLKIFTNDNHPYAHLIKEEKTKESQD